MIANTLGLVLQPQDFFVQPYLLSDIGDEFLLLGITVIEEPLVILDLAVYELRFRVEGFGPSESLQELLP